MIACVDVICADTREPPAGHLPTLTGLPPTPCRRDRKKNGPFQPISSSTPPVPDAPAPPDDVVRIAVSQLPKRRFC